jgi:nitroreductase
MPLDVPTAILQRRSIKSFKPDPIAPELLRQLVELTVAAPSSFNIQDWRIVIIQDPNQKAALGAACWNQPQITQAPVNLVFAADIKAGERDIVLPIGYAAEPRKHPGRMPFEFNVSLDRIDRPYQG